MVSFWYHFATFYINQCINILTYLSFITQNKVDIIT